MDANGGTYPDWGPEIRRFPRRQTNARWRDQGPGHAPAPSTASKPGEVPRYVVHLAVVTADLARAANLACALVRSLAFLPQLDAGETTVSAEDNQGVRHRVFCDRLLPDRRRCALRHEHPEPCSPTFPPA